MERGPIAITDVLKEPGYLYPDIAKQEGLASLLSVPMTVRDKCIGVLNCYTPEPHNFKETEISLVASVAHQAAVAIENTRWMEKALASEQELAARKLIERAKGILMKSRGLSEDEAFGEMRRTAMDSRRSLKDIAEAVILSTEMQHIR